MPIELDEWEANYLLDYLDKEADYTMGREPKVRNLRDKVQTAFDKSGAVGRTAWTIEVLSGPRL